MSPDLAFNTAVSFVTNTNWQAYSGEAQLSYLSQMAGLTVQSFVSAATGMAVAVAVVRGFGGAKGSGSLGNFSVDMTRSVLYALLPLSVVPGLFLAFQGVPQTLQGAATATTLEGAEQVIARGPPRRRSPSSSSAPTAAASSASTRRTRSRTRRSPRTWRRRRRSC